jgi:hypothetical protein
MEYGHIQAVICNPLARGGTVRVRISGATSDCAIFDPLTLEPKSQPLYVDGAGLVPEFVVERGNVYDIYFFDQMGAPAGDTLAVTVNDDVIGVPGTDGKDGVDGTDGKDGLDGADGVDGTDGVDGVDGADGVSLVSIRVDENSSTGKVLYNLSNDPENWIEAGDVVPGGLGQVKVSSSDSLGYLESKVTAGDDISITNSGTNLEINNTAPETFKTQASQYSTVKDFLNGVIEGTSGITVSVSADFNKIILSGAGIGGSGFTPRGAWDSVTTYNEGDGVWYYDSSVTPVINRYYVATATNTNIDPYTDGTGWVMMFSIDQLGDQLVKLDASDSTASFLLDKIVAGTGITFTRTVDAGGDFITIDGAPVWSIGVNGVDKTIADVSNTLDFVDGEVTEVTWDGNTIKVNHDTFTESGTVITHTATGLPKFDEYGHYKGQSDAIEISDVNGLETALDDAGDGKVSVDNSDTKGYLKDKLIAVGAVELYNIGSPTDKDIQIVGTGKVATDSGDVVGYLENKVIAGDNVTINKVPHLTGESLEVSVNLPELDDDEPIIAEYGNYSSIYLASNTGGAAELKVAGKYTEFPMNTKRIDNKVGGSFSTMNGVFSPEKEGYYVCTFNAFVHPSSSTSRNYPVYVSCSVEVSYDGNTWVDYGGSDSAKMLKIVFPSTGTYPEGYGKALTFHMVVHLKDNQYSGDHMMARIMIQRNPFNTGYNNSIYFQYPQFAWYELKKPVGIQGPKGDKGDTGEAGDTGAQGPQGNDGADGATGPQGAIGETGPQGVNGTDGADGAQGVAGADGIDGADGAQGPQGEQGDIGPQGVAGADGADGSIGPQGNDGAQGPQGAQGADGGIQVADAPSDGNTYGRKNNTWVEVEGGGGTASGELLELDITQISHGFTVPTAVYNNGSGWVAAQADNADTMATHVVIEVVDANTFKVSNSGRADIGAHGLTVGQYYFTSDSVAGGVTPIEPEDYSNPLFRVASATEIDLVPWRPTQSGGIVEGPQGPQGEVGAAGADGAQGDIGPQGPQGPQGFSDVEIVTALPSSPVSNILYVVVS